MPLPDHSFDITGGCDCGAIRYRIHVPPAADRPLSLTVYEEASNSGNPPAAVAPMQLPCSMLCCCDNCRTYTGSVLPPAYFCSQAGHMAVSALPVDAADQETVTRGNAAELAPRHGALEAMAQADEARPSYRPAQEVLVAGSEAASGTWVRWYRGAGCSADASRVFCGRCGTFVAFHFRPQEAWFGRPVPEGQEDIFDVLLGTVDKEHLDRDYMRPERSVNVPSALGWAREVVDRMSGIQHGSLGG